MFDFRNQDVVDDYYMFRKSSYQRESTIANRMRGVGASSSYADEGDEEVEVASVAPVSNSARASRLHKVRRGETLSSIARKHGVSLSTLMKQNHLKKTAKLKPGQILRYN